MMVQWVGLLGHVALILALVALIALAAWGAGLLIFHVRYRRRALAAEAELLEAPLPGDDRLPHVLIQLPTFNEGGLIERIASAVADFDWPRDKLHIQILDDSTDESAAVAARATSSLRDRGLDAILLHRTHREGFKAGALQEGLRRSPHEFTAIFDADYIPAPNFLRLCLRPMLRDSGVGLVQARCDFVNSEENAITSAQQRMLDGHFAVEQSTRSWAGHIVPFNGTCGIWRRAAIDAAGGWQGDTLAEDLDLSYRVQLAGWRALYLVTVAVPGELPSTVGGWRTQQFRWTKGFAQGARKLLPKVCRSDLPVGRKIAATFHLGTCLGGPLVGLMVAAGLVDVLFGPGPTFPVATLFALALLLWAATAAATMLLGQHLARGASMMAEVKRMPAIILTSLYGSLSNLQGVFEGWTGRASGFVRTPKSGLLAGEESRRP